MRNTHNIDGELRLLVAVRHMVREADGQSPSTAQIDGLLDERAAAAAARWWPLLGHADRIQAN